MLRNGKGIGSEQSGRRLCGDNNDRDDSIGREGLRAVDAGDSAADGNPLSLMGPGCASVLNSLMSTKRRLHALYAAWLGGEALYMYPFARAAPRPPADRAAGRPRDYDAVDYGARFEPRLCRLCGVAPECVHHIAFDCSHPALRAERAVTADGVRARTGAIPTAVVGARSRLGAPWALPGGPEADALAAFLAGSSLGDDELAFLGYRLLLAAPFPVEVARRYGFPAAGGVGLLLGAVRAQDVRPLCESWAVWADNRLSGIAAAWKAAVAAPP